MQLLCDRRLIKYRRIRARRRHGPLLCFPPIHCQRVHSSPAVFHFPRAVFLELVLGLAHPLNDKAGTPPHLVYDI